MVCIQLFVNLKYFVEKHLIFAILTGSLAILTGCSSTKFHNESVSSYDSLCPAEEKQCYWQLRKDGGMVGYDIQINPNSNEVRVTAKAKYDDHRLGNQWMEFYILFFDEQQVIYEKKVKIRGPEASHSFKFVPSTPVSASTITNIRMWVAS